jgi:hypothetical protein
MAYANQENAAIQLLPFLVDPTAVFGLVDAVRVSPATATSGAAAAGGDAAPSKAHGEQHDKVIQGSFVQKLLNQTQAAGSAVPAVLAELGLSFDRKTLNVAACCSCQAPLVGRLGVTKLGLDFCNTSCLNRYLLRIIYMRYLHVEFVCKYLNVFLAYIIYGAGTTLRPCSGSGRSILASTRWPTPVA